MRPRLLRLCIGAHKHSCRMAVNLMGDSCEAHRGLHVESISSTPSKRRSKSAVEGAIQVGPEVLDIFYTGGEADEVVLDAQLGAHLRPLIPVGHDGGLLDEALGAAQRGCDVCHLYLVHKLGRAPQVTIDFKADDTAIAVHLRLCDGVVGVALQPWIVDTGNVLMRLQALCQDHGAAVGTLHSQVQRLHPPIHQERRVGVDDAAQHVVHQSHRGNEIGFAGDSAGQHVVVACQVLGGRMEHQIRPQRNRPLVDRSGESTVYAHHGALSVAQLRNARHVHTPQVRVSG
mmetsp:Transcript_6207/g.17808  ORF Transcript_6207/g.17808 Transcript_6207/m.17808 type:complete len:287 (+) Transcript_6207:1208-2068(+)